MPLTREAPAPSETTLDPSLGTSPPPETLSLAAALNAVAESLREAETSPPPAESEPDRPSLFERRCPYCHDGLGRSPQVLCATCVTPHHAACFQEHRGCSLLGCGSERCLDLDGPASRVLCGSCSELTPSNAHFCTKCGVACRNTGVARESSAPVLRWRGLLRAAAMVLILGAVGGVMGWQESLERGVQLDQALYAQDQASLARLKEDLRSIQRAQRVLAECSEGGEPPTSLEELQVALRASLDLSLSRSSLALADLRHLREVGTDWELELGQDATGRPIAIGGLSGQHNAWSCDLEGRIRTTSREFLEETDL